MAEVVDNRTEDFSRSFSIPFVTVLLSILN